MHLLKAQCRRTHNSIRYHRHHLSYAICVDRIQLCGESGRKKNLSGNEMKGGNSRILSFSAHISSSKRTEWAFVWASQAQVLQSKEQPILMTAQIQHSNAQAVGPKVVLMGPDNKPKHVIMCASVRHFQ